MVTSAHLLTPRLNEVPWHFSFSFSLENSGVKMQETLKEDFFFFSGFE